MWTLKRGNLESWHRTIYLLMLGNKTHYVWQQGISLQELQGKFLHSKVQGNKDTQTCLHA